MVYVVRPKGINFILILEFLKKNSKISCIKIFFIRNGLIQGKYNEAYIDHDPMINPQYPYCFNFVGTYLHLLY